MLWIFVAMIALGVLGVWGCALLNPVLTAGSNYKLFENLEASDLRSAWKVWKILLLSSFVAAFIGTAGLISLLIK